LAYLVVLAVRRHEVDVLQRPLWQQYHGQPSICRLCTLIREKHGILPGVFEVFLVQLTFLGYFFGVGFSFTLGMIFLSTWSALPSSGDGCARRATPTAEDVVEGGTDFFVGSLFDGMGLLVSLGQRLGCAVEYIVDRAGAVLRPS
jgi:hypothetical protein